MRIRLSWIWVGMLAAGCGGGVALAPLPTPTPTLAIANGGFETGDLSGWQALGDASVASGSFGVAPSQGSFQALVSNLPSPADNRPDFSGTNAVPLAALEAFLEIPTGSLNLLNRGIVIEGSAIRTTFQARAGQVLTFDWNFLTDELPRNFNDFAFVSIVDTAALVDVLSPLLRNTAQPVPLLSQTSYQTFTFTIPSSGSYTLSLGVVDVADPNVASALLVDNVRLSP